MSEKGVPKASIAELDEPEGLDQKLAVNAEMDISLTEQVKRHIQESIDKQFQSAKDKRWDKLEKQINQMAAQNKNTPEVSTEEGISFDAKAAELLTKIGLNQDVEALSLLDEYLAKGEGAELLPFVEDVLQLVLTSAKPTPASLASITQPGGSLAPSVSLDSLYEQEKTKLKPGDLLGLLALKRDFRQKGLDIF